MRIELRPIVLLLIVLCVFLHACGKSEIKDDLTLIKERLGADVYTAPWLSDLELGFAAYAARDAVVALQYLSAAREKGCTDPLMLFRLAVVLENQGRSAEASALFFELEPALAALYPGHSFLAGLWVNLGNIEYRHGNAEYSEGRVEAALGRFEAAFEMYEKALLALNSGGRGPKSDIYYSMGMALRRLDRYAEAANWMEKADRGDFRVNYFLAEVYNELKKHDLAMRRMRRAVQLDPDSSRALGALGHFYYALSEREEKAMRFKAAAKAIEQSIGLYRRAVAAGGDMYQEYLQAAEWRVNDLARLQAAAKQGLLRREVYEGEEESGDPGFSAPEIPASFLENSP
jgi:tetratricopeptide (TPR) repeat protein